MRQVLMIAAALAMLSVTVSPAAAQKLDKNGKCHGADGKFAKADVCKGAGAPVHSYKLDDKGKCHDEKGKFAKAEMCHH
jgi:hypothetical protein